MNQLKLNDSGSGARWNAVLVPGLAAMVVIHVLLFWNLRHDVRRGYSDFAQLYTAGRILREGAGEKLYEYQTQWRVQRSFAPDVPIRHGPLPYNHAPYEAWIFAVLARLPYLSAYVVWAIVNLILLVAVAAMLHRYLPTRQNVVFALLLLLAFFPIFVALLQGQDSILLLFLYTLAFHSMCSGRSFLAGIFLGLGLFKLHLILPMMLILALHRELRAIAGFAVSAITMAIASVAAAGWHNTVAYPIYVWNLSQDRAASAITPALMPNVRGLLDGLLDNRLPPTYVMLLIALASAALIVTCAWKWNRMPQGSPSETRYHALRLGFALAVVTVVLVSFHLYAYDASLLTLPLIVVGGWVFEDGLMPPALRQTALITIAALLFTPLWALLLFRLGRLNLMSLVFLFFGWIIFRVMSKQEISTAPRDFVLRADD